MDERKRRRAARAAGIAGIGLGLALAFAAAPVRADHRDFAGRVKSVSEGGVTIENRMGDRRSFVRGKKTRVRGGRTSWEGLRPGDEVIVDWHLGDQPPRARGVRVIERPR